MEELVDVLVTKGDFAAAERLVMHEATQAVLDGSSMGEKGE